MDNEKKKAQSQIDKALAEVARLKTVAVEIETANEHVLKSAEETVEKLQTNITDLAFQESKAIESLRNAEEDVEVESKKKNDITEAVETKKSELGVIESEIFDAKETLSSIIDKASKTSDMVNSQILSKKSELYELEESFIKKQKEYLRKEISLKSSIDKLNNELSATEVLVEKAKEVGAIVNAEKVEAEQKTAEAKFNLEALEAKIETGAEELTDIKTSIKVQSEILIEKTKEAETATEEVNELVKQRIESKAFMQELQNKESNLKRRYEDVGLEYK